MAAVDRRRTAAARVKEAQAARDELRAALTKVGISLPALRIDGPSLGGDEPCPLLDLGRCPPEVARRLAAVIRRRGRTAPAKRPPDHEPVGEREVGRLVRDETSGRTGLLMAVVDYADPAQCPPYPRRVERLAFVRPEHGGREWTARPDRVRVLAQDGGGADVPSGGGALAGGRRTEAEA
ncbi:hypothetical protein RKE29_09740 [Streptomyces sp. B1866]|uniref:hypothetical protein n=1 Tax=Streptomyces sp. B1866 TaxID=3075431 RepID=UPI00288EF517|nr:hypothetical protein [Streptomyces sp. B1866]MDT3396923.1 hypothetical protein [Streptomyces sp. B1866]